jgi:LmbE family N-acetylglucosaminyl deacetylase
MVTTRPLRRLALALLIAAPRLLFAQERGATALGEAVAGLDVTARVLLIGAHPDDEDTQLLTWLARGRQVETGYLSLTRGDGGQNLIGNELGPLLGMIRTEELLAARRLDGGRQFFTRAYDFGFSKTAEETYTHWPKDSILRDVVTVVRAFRPQVIVAVFSGTPRDGHGHHQVSGMLAREVFDAAADTVRFPMRSTLGLGPWSPTKFYRAARFNPAEATLSFNVGELSPLRGRSYAEIASESRSQHLSQGFGVLQRRGTSMDYLTLEASRVGGGAALDGTRANGGVARETSPLDGIDAGWTRFGAATLDAAARTALDSLPAAIAEVRRAENLAAPAPMVTPLARVVRLATTAREGAGCGGGTASELAMLCDAPTADLIVSLESALRRARAALLAAAGVLVEATAPRELVAVGDTLPVTISVYNQGSSPVTMYGANAGLQHGMGAADRGGAVEVLPDSVARVTVSPVSTSASQPWWLAVGRRGGIFVIPAGYVGAVNMAVGEDRVTDSRARVSLRIAGVPVTTDVGPVVHRYADPARGEIRRPVASVPPVSVTFDDEIEYARAGVRLDRIYTVRLKSATSAPRAVSVALSLPDGLRADSVVRSAALVPFGSAALTFRVRGTLPAGRHMISATATSAGETYRAGYLPIAYEHIRPLRYYQLAAVLIEAVDAALPKNRSVGYIQGVGDNVAPMLSQLGIAITTVAPDQLERMDLSRFGALVVGPRAFAASNALVSQAKRLQDFARAGGTVVVQYGQAEIQAQGILPYPVTLARTAQRVTDETAPVRVLAPGDRLLASPNRIGARDFEQWVQERAVYMPSSFDPHYRPLLEMNDPGEPPNQGAILVTPLGKGAYVYTTLALFRQLPAGVPGAARLFLNLLAADGRRQGTSLPRP